MRRHIGHGGLGSAMLVQDGQRVEGERRAAPLGGKLVVRARRGGRDLEHALLAAEQVDDLARGLSAASIWPSASITDTPVTRAWGICKSSSRLTRVIDAAIMVEVHIGHGYVPFIQHGTHPVCQSACHIRAYMCSSAKDLRHKKICVID